MTQMPRSGRHALATSLAGFSGSLLGRVVLRAWHGACFSLLVTGCIYLGPITLLEEENVPPLVYSHTRDAHCQEDYPELEEALCVDYDDFVVYVIAEDADDDALEFYWWGSISGAIENAVASASAGKQSSQVSLSPEEMIDGEILECVVSDGSDTDVKVTWTLVVN